LIYMYWNEPYFQCILHVEMWWAKTKFLFIS
jgi:hypothetical protein